MHRRPARVLLVAVVTALLVAAAIGVNVALLGYADRGSKPAGRLSPRGPITATSTTPLPTTTDDDGSHGSERDD